ncbi:hypothetical protein DFI02_1167 [Rhizobium sp. PP-F2F-G20b]|nr:hypothetical protein DFI02_1167 [Rhizobium sp. PP-F2F-G20b]
MTEAVAGPALSKDEATAIRQWRQGDFTLDITVFPTGDIDEDGFFAEIDDVAGWVVISQTCDIVNIGQGDRHHVVVAPLIVLTDSRKLSDTVTGATPSTAPLGNPPSDHHVVDLTKAATIQKKALAKVTRHDGFTDELSRANFGRRLERRYGRFAFPDDLNAPLGALRDQAKSKYNKNSDVGRVYQSVYMFRVAASPDFDTPDAAIRIMVVLKDHDDMRATREEIAKELKALESAKKFTWPASFKKADPLFTLKNRDEITARQWELSMGVDLDYLSDPN